MTIQAIRILANRFCDEHYQLVVLACAGISMGCPSEFHGGAELVRHVIEHVRGEFADFWNYRGTDIGQLYDELVTAHGERGKERFLDAIGAIGPEFYPANQGHKAILKLYLEGVIKAIYTLNVDWLFEASAHELILPAGWRQAQNLSGISSTHPFGSRWGSGPDRRRGAGPPILHKIHGCISTHPRDTVWSAALLGSAAWPDTCKMGAERA